MERKVKIRIRIDFKAMKYFNMYNLLYRKKFVYIYLGLTVLCLAFSVFSFLQAEPNYIIAVAFALFSAYLLYQTLNLEKMIDKNIINYFYNRRPIEQNLDVTEETLTITAVNDPEKQVTYDWVQVTSIYEIPQYIYLYIGKHPIIIDKDPNAILDGVQQDLLAIIQEKAATKPYKMVDKEFVKTPITYVHQEFTEEAMSNLEDLHVEDVQTIEEATPVEPEEDTKKDND